MSARQFVVIGALAPRPATDLENPMAAPFVSADRVLTVSLREESGQAEVDGEHVSWHAYRRRRDGREKVGVDQAIVGSFPI